MEKFNSLAEAIVDSEYFGAGKMGTESKLLGIKISEDDIEAICADENFTLKVYGKEVEWEIERDTMKLVFNYSEE